MEILKSSEDWTERHTCMATSSYYVNNKEVISPGDLCDMDKFAYEELKKAPESKRLHHAFMGRDGEYHTVNVKPVKVVCITKKYVIDDEPSEPDNIK